jgi:hypothetical protein
MRRLKLIKGCKCRIEDEDEDEEEETLINEIFSKYPSFVWIFAVLYVQTCSYFGRVNNLLLQ